MCFLIILVTSAPESAGLLVREIMSTASHKTSLTAEEFARAREDGQRRELVLGVIRMMSPAGGRHGKVALRLGAMLLDYVQAHDLGDVFAAETGFLLTRDPDTVRAPDVAFVKREHINTLDDLSGFVPLAPDLVEVMGIPVILRALHDRAEVDTGHAHECAVPKQIIEPAVGSLVEISR